MRKETRRAVLVSGLVLATLTLTLTSAFAHDPKPILRSIYGAPIAVVTTYEVKAGSQTDFLDAMVQSGPYNRVLYAFANERIIEGPSDTVSGITTFISFARYYDISTANFVDSKRNPAIAQYLAKDPARVEAKITASHKRIAELMLDPPDAAPLPETLEAIEHADLITVGPGSLYTSLICNLLVQGMPAALAKARGMRVYICNLMTQANESLGLTASQHIERIYEHTRAPIFDYALVNTGVFSPETLARYAAEGAFPIIPDIERIEALGVRVITGDFASEESGLRQGPGRVTDALLSLGNEALAKRG